MTISTAVTGRELFTVRLAPVSGARFQPTGFPDLGAATFEKFATIDGKPGWVNALVVESAQSVANWLESTAWPRGSDAPVDAVADLPYVRVTHADDGRYLTSSRTEAHRLASAFVKDAKLDGRQMLEVLRERLGLRDDTPISPREIARAVFALDPFCLLHGVFFADRSWPGQPRVSRAITGVIEATDVRRAPYGGVKRDHVRHAITDRNGDDDTDAEVDTEKNAGGSKEGYGTIPYHRVDWTAREITAYFTIDLAQIASYGLSEPAGRLLATLARWEIRALLDGGLRLRTACDLAPVETEITDTTGHLLPDFSELDAQLHELVTETTADLDHRGALPVTWTSPRKPKDTKTKSA